MGRDDKQKLFNKEIALFVGIGSLLWGYDSGLSYHLISCYKCFDHIQVSLELRKHRYISPKNFILRRPS